MKTTKRMIYKKPETVSIVTPSYNQGRFISETIESVLNQAGDFYIDYIIIDGASFDNSVEIIRHYEALINHAEWPIRCRGINFRWLSEKDRGQSDAIIKGFALAKGDILAWLNSDDTYLPDAVSKAIEAFRQCPEIGLFYGRARFTDENGAVVGEVETGLTDYYGLAILNLICQPTTFFRKNAWDAVNGVDPELIYTMDHDLWIRITQKFASSYSEEYLATYRLHAGAKTVAMEHVVEFQAEILLTLKKHYNWAPANRVYGYCNSLVNTRYPKILSNIPLLRSIITILITIFEYLRMNKRIRFADLKMLNSNNAHKVWRGLIKGRQGQTQ